MSAGRQGEEAGDGAVAVAAGGASAVAVIASSCCVPVLAPLIVSLFGVGGAIWAAALKPYAPWALAVAGALLAWGHSRVWTAARLRAVTGAAACPPKRRRWVLWTLWSATTLWAAAGLLHLLQIVAPEALS